MPDAAGLQVRGTSGDCKEAASVASYATSIEAGAPANNGQRTSDNGQFPTPDSHRPPASIIQPHITLGGTIEPSNAAHAVAHLVITAAQAKNWHIYALAEKDPVDVSKPTLIALTQTSGLKIPPARAQRKARRGKIHCQPIRRKSRVITTNRFPGRSISQVPVRRYPRPIPDLAGIVGYQVLSGHLL